MADHPALSAIFKAYDVRGVVPDELNVEMAYAIGYGFAKFTSGEDDPGDRGLVVARDMRASGPELVNAIIAGASAAGAKVTELGLASTDMLYFATGYLSQPGIMLTASHNPAKYNGMKFCLANAAPVGEESGLVEVLRYAEEILPSVSLPIPVADATHRELLDEFAAHVHSFVDVERLRPLKIVADAANGMGGLVAPRVFSGLPMSLDLMYGELDGNFPNHPADPIQPENLVDLQARILATEADVGLAFDGDADRVFLVDELGEPLSGSTTTAIVANAMLKKFTGATVLYNCICSKTVREVIAEQHGIGIRTRVGHSFIKAVMAETDAVFGGEHSGHYYFRDNYRADSGIIAALVVLEVLSESGGSLSELRKPFERYVASGEINNVVNDQRLVSQAVKHHYAALGATIDELDGMTVDLGTWWFNLRPSNTEPLLRLNVEASDSAACQARVDEVLTIIRESDGA
jgi:phosphomannomutase